MQSTIRTSWLFNQCVNKSKKVMAAEACVVKQEALRHTLAVGGISKSIFVSFLFDASVCLYSLGTAKLPHCLLKSFTFSPALEPIWKRIYKPFTELEQRAFLFMFLYMAVSGLCIFPFL